MGSPVGGVKLGILVLDTRFQRLPGDVGNALTWSFPVHFHVVRGATPQRLIGGTSSDVLPLFFKAIDELVALGMDGIATTCGFLAALQPDLSAYSPIPIATSSLLQIPLVQRILPKSRKVGVITTDKASLTTQHFVGVGASPDVPVVELPADGAIRLNMARGIERVSYAEQEQDVLTVVRELLKLHPEVGAIVGECANLGPYSAVLQETFGVAVYDAVTLVEWFHAGLAPGRWPQR